MGFDLPTFTLIHVVISVIALIAGLVLVGGLVSGTRLGRWEAWFLVTTILTSVTGFGFPFTAVAPPHVVGAISLVVLALCLVARYVKNLEGRWRAIYVVTAVTALYLNLFVLIVQLFQKTPAMAKLAPTQRELPFVVTQVLVLALFVWLGRSALQGYRGGSAKAQAHT